MTKARVLRLAAAGLLAPLALAATPAATSVGAVAPLAVGAATTVSQLGDDVLAQLPTNAAEAGLSYAPQLVKVDVPLWGDRERLTKLGLDLTEHAGHDYVEVVLHAVEHEDLLRNQGFTWTVVTPDLIALEHERIQADAAYFRSTSISPLPSGRTGYRVLGDYPAEIDQLVAENPDLAKRISLGESVEGRDLTGIEIGVGVNAPEDGRPVMLMFGNHHAREWPSAEAPMEWAHALVQQFNAGDARTVDLLTRARVIIVPVSNPDGYDASRTSGDLVDLNSLDGGGTASILATPGNAYKRKNCRIVDGQTQPAGSCVAFTSQGGTGIGIDLNRNYGALWGGPGANGALPTGEVDIWGNTGTLSPLYRGPAPFSEPETQAIRSLISSRQVTTLISNHTFSNLLLRPVGVEPSTTHPDGFPIGFAPDECFTQPDGVDNGMQALGERMSAQTGYSNQFGWELYDTTGTTEDYSYNATGGYGYTFEIGPDEFHPPFEEWIAEWTGDNPAAKGVDADAQFDITTGTAQICDGDYAPAEVVGGGLAEAYMIALENAANQQTHSRITGEAPAGAQISVTRTGTFPLWDKTPFEDTVTTSMVATQDGTFTYHVNPSTRPFNDSRAYAPPSDAAPGVTIVSKEDRTGSTAPASQDFIPIDVPAGVNSLVVELTSTIPTDDYDLALFTPDLVEVDSSGGTVTDERVEASQPSGLQVGEWAARVDNFAAAGPWNMTITMGTLDPAAASAELLLTPRTEEFWTVT